MESTAAELARQEDDRKDGRSEGGRVGGKGEMSEEQPKRRAPLGLLTRGEAPSHNTHNAAAGGGGAAQSAKGGDKEGCEEGAAVRAAVKAGWQTLSEAQRAAGWTVHWSRREGRIYYFNKREPLKEKATQWHAPFAVPAVVTALALS